MDLYPRPETVARALPDAIGLAEKNGEALREALGPTVSQALKISVRKNPQPLIDVIFPLLGPAIRKSIEAALQGMIQSLNQTAEFSLDPALRYRAWKARIPFGEYVLLHTLIYRVEQVYLIHNNTGLPLRHAQAGSLGETTDPDMVASMLTAIQDFVRDSFQASKTDALDQVRMGERLLQIVTGPSASIAAVIRGNPPAALRQQMVEVLEGVHFRHAADFDEFSGDDAPFERSEPDLERLLQTQRMAPSGMPSRKLRIVALLVLGGLALLGGYWAFGEYCWGNYVADLEREPGILVTRTRSEWLGWGKHVLYGLRDPLAADTSALKGGFGMMRFPIEEHWEAFQSLDPLILKERILKVMAPPATAHLEFEDGILTASGQASAEWMQRARILSGAIPGINRYLDRELEDVEPMARIKRRIKPPDTISLNLEDGKLTVSGAATNDWLQAERQTLKGDKDVHSFDDSGVTSLEEQRLNKFKAHLEAYSIYFQEGTTNFRGPTDAILDGAVSDWKQIKGLATTLKLTYSLQVTGQSDATGTVQQNAVLSKKRADVVRQLLLKRGLESGDVTIDSIQAKQNDPRLRRVLFLVIRRSQ